MKTDIVLSQFGKNNSQRFYLKKVQRYSTEETFLFEEFFYGLFLGTAEFADRLKPGFLKKAHRELPQQIMLLKKHELEKLLQGLSDVLECNLESFREFLRRFSFRLIRH
ncbi:MAG: hypothetical protein LWW97_04385 [Deltaproteobacteria bacterium]|nr:hypothetical protein [Deltaproteobacteria bacterium]